MGRKRPRRRIDGWLIVDKPAGLTSAAVVGRVRHMTEAAKVGHAGTLDPLATGVLPLALGEATKTVPYVMDGSKVYRFTVRWGESRTTDDADGDIVAVSVVRPAAATIESALTAYTGDIEQVPPDFSAIKIDGRRAYALARAAEPVALAPRQVHIDRFDLTDVVDADYASFEVVAGKGAYMRSLCRDLAHDLGTLGHIVALRRIAVGPFFEENAISLEHLAAVGHIPRLAECLLPVETALDDIPVLALTAVEARRLQRGQPIAALPVATRSPLSRAPRDTVYCAMADGRAVGLARIEGGEIRPVRILNLS